MPCFYAMPEANVFAYQHPFAPRMCRRSAPCFAPCLSPLLVVAALLFLPALVRIGFTVILGLMSLATHIVFAMLAIYTVRALLNDDEDDDGETRKSKSSGMSARCPAAACFARMKAHAQQARAATQSACDKPEAATTAKKERRHDLSTARLETTSEGVKVIVSAPGVAPSDLDVSVVEHSLRIKGETKRGVDVFCVSRHIVPPRHVDVNTAACTHADGEISIALSKKVGRRIPVTAAATPTTAEDDEPATTDEALKDAATQAAIREVTGEGSEGEWEPLA